MLRRERPQSEDSEVGKSRNSAQAVQADWALDGRGKPR